MSVEQVKYLTKDQVVEYSIPQLKGMRKSSIQDGFVFPILTHEFTSSGSSGVDSGSCQSTVVRVRVSVRHFGSRMTESIALDLPLIVFNELQSLPTHDSVWPEPRLISGSLL